MSIDTLDILDSLEEAEHVPAPAEPARARRPLVGAAVVRPALLAGEEHQVPDPSIFRGTD
jgi:hypothetical protein